MGPSFSEIFGSKKSLTPSNMLYLHIQRRDLYFVNIFAKTKLFAKPFQLVNQGPINSLNKKSRDTAPLRSPRQITNQTNLEMKQRCL